MELLKDDYSYRELTNEEFWPLFRQLRPQVFGRTFTFRSQEALSEEETEKLRALAKRQGKDLFTLNLGIYSDDEFVGWHTGRQDGPETYYMTNTALLAPHQGKGLYTALLPEVIERVTSEGFQIIYSRHTITNNRVIVPKLKAGFILTGMEVDDRFGTLVRLSYYSNGTRRKIMDVRAGEARMDNELSELL